MIFAGAAYAVIGVGFAALGNEVDTSHVRFWRLAAWGASAAVGAAHIAYEHHRVGSPPRRAAVHAASGVALGAFGLAVAANVHWMLLGAPGQRAPLLALPLWPVISAIPAFLLAFAAAAVLARVSPRPR
ncbi:MAG: hypothetical protein M3167_08080 [Acidobacteriota bacterium]|nr:hypothetical protein [Acidobacteriota bacterium]